MKKILLPFIFLLLSTIGISQEIVPAKKWSFASIGLRTSGFSNNYGDNMSYEDIQRMLKDPNDISVEMEGMLKSEEFYTSMSGGKLGFQVQLNNEITSKSSKSIVVFADVHVASELLLDYDRGESDNLSGSYSQDYIGWCLLRERVDLGVEYNYRTSYKDIGFSLGPAVTVGKSFNDRLLIMTGEDAETTQQTKAVSGYTMAYGQLLAKMDYDIPLEGLQNFNVFIQGKYGAGYEVGHRSFDYLTTAFDLTLGASYKL